MYYVLRISIRRILGILFASACAMPTGHAEYLSSGSPAAAGAKRIALIYNGKGHRNWRSGDFTPLLSYTNRDGRPLGPMFDSFLLLALKLETGHAICPGFGPPADREALLTYMDQRLFGGRNDLRTLDDDAEQVKKSLHAPGMRWKVFLTIPYPDPRMHTFGPVSPGGKSLDLAGETDRLQMVRWYMREATRRWDAAGYRNLDLVGWYWIHEASKGPDLTLLPRVGDMVRSKGGRFLWIPYNGAAGAARWRELGFDAAVYQPNYAFEKYQGPEDLLHYAADFARENGMGVEIEVESGLWKIPEYRKRYEAYLRVGREKGYQKALLAWYMGTHVLLEMAHSNDPLERRLYDDTYRFIAGLGP